MTLIKEIGGNARYLTFSASQVPVDTARGQIAAGMCIDVYGRSQSEWEQRHIGRETMAYHTPTAASSVSCDPIGMFRGAPNRERAQMFIDFVLSQEGQRLWNIRLGVPGGPRRYSLQRLPVRSDMYTDEFRKDMSAPDAQPFQLAGKFTYEGAWTGALFGVLRVLIRVMVIDCQDELQAAWKAILDAGGPDAVPPEVMAEFAALPFAHEEGADIAKALRQSEQGTILAREWGLFFREHYGNVVKMLE